MAERRQMGQRAYAATKPATDLDAWQNGLVINPDALEDELKHQPETFGKIGIALAEAISLRDAAKQNVAETEAEFAIEYRREAAGADEKAKRPTDKEVEAATMLDKGVIAARNELNDAQREVGLLTAMKEAYKDRGYALGRLVDLHLEGYYGSDQATLGGSSRLKNDGAARAKADIRDRSRRERDERGPPWKD
jgi:hypothetical protein